MAAGRPDYLWAVLGGPRLLLSLLWLGVAVLTGALVVLMYTRWGQWHPLRKCFVLSLLAHLLLVAYSTTVYIVPSMSLFGDDVVRVFLSDGPAGDSAAPNRDAQPFAAAIEAPKAQAPPGARAAADPPPMAPRPPDPKETAPPAPKSPTEPPASVLQRPPDPPKTAEVSSTKNPRDPVAETRPEHLPRPSLASEGAGPGEGPPSDPLSPTSRGAKPQLTRGSSEAGSYQVPQAYSLRTAPNRSQVARRLGASPQTEAAIQAALLWLAENQEPDGRWSVRRHGGGRESYEAGRDRQGAGSQADTGITGLALLALTANGNTHLEGTYRANVRRGIELLLRVQAPDGNLAGQAEVYEFMYCHAMATLALSEVMGMSGDQRLREPLQRAVAYIVAAQDPSGGGWRYRAGDPGDTSQLGWQLMALKSAELAGLVVPDTTWHRAARFLESVSGGNYRGLASYRPGERFSRSMTAEALACREFLGLLPSIHTSREAADYLLGELPGESDPGNLYYWYYATMALYSLQGPHWNPWSGALQKTLLSTQRRAGPLAGSWDPTTRWDGYGGRVYSTAMAALCLQAYYRFLPMPNSLHPND